MASSPPAPSTSASDPADTSTSKRTASAFLISKSEREAARNWDIFYKKNETRFFKDRHWTDREFEDLSSVQEDVDEDGGVEWEESELMQRAADVKGKGKARAEPVLLEVGCGVGNMIYPVSSLWAVACRDRCLVVQEADLKMCPFAAHRKIPLTQRPLLRLLQACH
jgi:hypothetical protein